VDEPSSYGGLASLGRRTMLQRDPMAKSTDASLIISTRNRCDELRRALNSAVKQSVPLEILVLDDSSTDGTPEMVRHEFPQVTILTSARQEGYIAQRNRGSFLAHGRFVFSIDDDAEFSSADVVAQSLLDFDHPRIGAVAIPHIDKGSGTVFPQLPRSQDGQYVTAQFRGTAYAVRRDVFQRLGGFRSVLLHQGEEKDFCLRMLSDGLFTRLGRSDPIIHYESPKRDWSKITRLGRRNDILFAWQNVPLPYFPVHLIATTVNGVRFGLSHPALLIPTLMGLKDGYQALLGGHVPRRTVSTASYRLSRILVRRGPLLMSEALANLGSS
jgi:GT2 family glycosyltransferase